MGKKQSIEKVRRADFKKHYKNITQIALYPNDALFENAVLSKAYQDVNVCPGLYITYNWDFDNAVGLDDNDEFSKDLFYKINAVYDMFGNYQVKIINK